MKRLLGFLLSMGAAISGAHAKDRVETRSISAEELQTLDPEVIDEILKNQLWNIFEKRNHRNGKTVNKPLEHIFLKSKAYETEKIGVCKIDTLVLRTARNERTSHRSTPVKTYGFYSYHDYFLLNEAIDPYKLSNKDDSQLAYDSYSSKPCEVAANDRQKITSDDVDILVTGLQLFRTVSATVHEIKSSINECKLVSKTESCESIIAGFSEIIPYSIEKCKEDSSLGCIEIRFSAGSRGDENVIIGILKVNTNFHQIRYQTAPKQKLEIKTLTYSEELPPPIYIPNI